MMQNVAARMLTELFIGNDIPVVTTFIKNNK